MKVNNLVLALLLANSQAVQVEKFLSPLNYFIRRSQLAQLGSSSEKFMSISGQLDAESGYESSHAAYLEDYIKEASDSGFAHAKTPDTQRYDSKLALQDTMSGEGSLGTAFESSKKEMLKQQEELRRIQANRIARAPQSQSAVNPLKAEKLAQTANTKQPSISAAQLAEDALNAPLNINAYINDHGLDQQNSPSGAAKADQAATDQDKNKNTKGTLSAAQQEQSANQTGSYAPQESAPQSSAANETQGAQAIASTDSQANTTAAPAENQANQTAAPAEGQSGQTAAPEKKEDGSNVDQEAAKLENLSKKVSESINGKPGSSLSIADMVTGAQPTEQKKEEGKLSNQDIMNVINSLDPQSQESQEKKEPSRPSWAGQGFRVDLSNEDGAGYIGTIYLGSEDQPAKVLFDTGSDFLAVTSDLCLDQSLGKQEVDEPVFNTTSFVYVPSGKDLRKCKSTAYLSKQSKSGHRLGKDDEQLDYGSAKLSGKLFNDRTCLDANQTACVAIDFLGLYQAKGLDDIDGILGLAVHPEKDRRNLNYVWAMKNSKVIDQAIVSFSIAGPESDDTSYAIFGGLNENQIVGGVGGLKKIQTMAYRPDWMHSVKQWALEGRNMYYNGEEFNLAKEQKWPAIIDTGSSNFGVPDQTFQQLREKWEKDLGTKGLDCVNDDNFCQVMTPCKEVAPKLKPVGIQIADVVFEMTPELYLHQAEGTRCQFAIHTNQMKGSSGNLYLIGDTLLRHLYQVYDFDQETISLGVNTHSEGKVRMYEKKPTDGSQVQTEDQKMSMELRDRFNDQI